MTAIRKLWRKCLPLCASHFSINQPAIGLSSGWVSPAPLQGAATQPSDYLYKYPHRSPSFLFSGFAPSLWLLFFSFFSFSITSVCLTELSFCLSVARGSWLPCWCRCLKLWGPRGHQSWKSPFPPTALPVGRKFRAISWDSSRRQTIASEYFISLPCMKFSVGGRENQVFDEQDGGSKKTLSHLGHKICQRISRNYQWKDME